MNDLLRHAGLYQHRRTIGLGQKVAFIATVPPTEVLAHSDPLSLPHARGFMTGISKRLGISVTSKPKNDRCLTGVYWHASQREWKGIFKAIGKMARPEECGGTLVLLQHGRNHAVITPATGTARVSLLYGRGVVELFSTGERLFYQAGAGTLLNLKQTGNQSDEEWLGLSKYTPKTFYVYANPKEDIERRIAAFERTTLDPRVERRREHIAVAT